ncbi:MAG: hypothetical protein LBR58_10470, partial [Propionibacteriaceae bacterium]|nr:hypothetical protein [Propionibacteriaceae bacterium]
ADVRACGALGDGVTDDAAALQAAVDALPEGGTLLLPFGRYRITRPVEVRRACRIEGAGAFPRFGSVARDFNSINAPIVTPMLAGSVIVQTAPEQDGLRLRVTGAAVHLRGVGIEFEGAHRFSATGHGIAAEPDRHLGGFDNGLSGSVWDNVVVAGHDGDHYGLRVVNGIYNDIRAFQSFGGGVVQLVNDSAVNGHYGNTVFHSLYGQVFAGGSADGIRLESVTDMLNLLAFVRPQVTVGDMTATFPGARPPTAAQQMLRAVGQVPWVSLLQYDFETTVGSGITPPGPDCWLDPAGLLGGC